MLIRDMSTTLQIVIYSIEFGFGRKVYLPRSLNGFLFIVSLNVFENIRDATALYPPCPLLSQWATRVTVAVDVLSISAISRYDFPSVSIFTICQRLVNSVISAIVNKSLKNAAASFSFFNNRIASNNSWVSTDG